MDHRSSGWGAFDAHFVLAAGVAYADVGACSPPHPSAVCRGDSTISSAVRLGTGHIKTQVDPPPPPPPGWGALGAPAVVTIGCCRRGCGWG